MPAAAISVTRRARRSSRSMSSLLPRPVIGWKGWTGQGACPPLRSRPHSARQENAVLQAAESEEIMPAIKVWDIAYGRLRSPDLDVQEQFLTDFGMVRVARTPTALYMRGSDPFHHLHVTEKGDPAYLGMAWHAKSEDDLKALAKQPGASGIEHMDEPGGGLRVRLKEPNGYTIEVVYGMDAVLPIQANRQHVNSGPEPLNRRGELMRIRKGPSSVKRIAHAVMGTPRNIETVKWF